MKENKNHEGSQTLVELVCMHAGLSVILSVFQVLFSLYCNPLTLYIIVINLSISPAGLVSPLLTNLPTLLINKHKLTSLQIGQSYKNFLSKSCFVILFTMGGDVNTEQRTNISSSLKWCLIMVTFLEYSNFLGPHLLVESTTFFVIPETYS